MIRELSKGQGETGGHTDEPMHGEVFQLLMREIHGM